MHELFQECQRGNILIGTFRLDKDVRFKRSKAIIKYSTAAVVQKEYVFTAHPPSHTQTHTQPPSLTSPFHFICLFLARGEKVNLISIRLNCGGQHYQFKRPGDLTAPTPRWLITSQLWWAILSPLSLTLVKRQWWKGHWLGATHDKCCPYYWSHWKTGPGNIRLQQANHTLCIPRGQKRLARYKPLFTLQWVIERYSATRLCDVSLTHAFPLFTLTSLVPFLQG